MRSFYLIGIAVLLILLIVFLFRGGARRLVSFRGRSRHRHPITRIACGAAGVALATVLGVWTYLSVARAYEIADLGANAVVRVPTKPAPPLPVPSKGADENRPEHVRLLVDFIIADVDGKTALPLHVEQFDVRWPQEQEGKVAREFKVGNALFRATLEEAHVVSARQSPADSNRPREPRYRIGPVCHLDARSYSWAPTVADGGCSVDAMDKSVLKSLFGERIPLQITGSLLSTCPSPYGNIHVFVLAERVADDDPLREVPLAELVQSHQAQMVQEIKTPSASSRNVTRREGRHFDESNLGGLIVHLRLSALLLLCAAVLLAQVFKRRGLALAGTIAAMVLYAATLDYMTTRAALAKMKDPSASAYVQRAAARIAGSSYLYGDTAHKEVSQWEAGRAATGP